MKDILVPCDFSDAAVQAYKFAVDIARLGGSRVTLLHIIEMPATHEAIIPPTLELEESVFKVAVQKARKKFATMIKRWPLPGRRVDTQIRFGRVNPTVLEFIKEEGIDLVVMGTKGATGMREFLVGSNTEKMVRMSPVPVIALKKSVKASSIRNIVFPNTLRADQEELTMKVKALQHFFKARLNIVYINTPADFRSDRQTIPLLNAFAKRFMIRDYTASVYNDTSHESGIINFAHEIGADMIVMATHGRRGISHLLLGSIAEDVVNHIDCPIWTFAVR